MTGYEEIAPFSDTQLRKRKHLLPLLRSWGSTSTRCAPIALTHDDTDVIVAYLGGHNGHDWFHVVTRVGLSVFCSMPIMAATFDAAYYKFEIERRELSKVYLLSMVSRLEREIIEYSKRLGM